jgi:hypothetical protein
MKEEISSNWIIKLKDSSFAIFHFPNMISKNQVKTVKYVHEWIGDRKIQKIQQFIVTKIKN